MEYSAGLEACSGHATSALAYCTVEFDFAATMAGGSTLSQPTRNSVVLRKGDDGWKWTHWHSSLAVLPASPAQGKAKGDESPTLTLRIRGWRSGQEGSSNPLSG